MKKAVIINPYWQTLGGGEKYTATVAKTLLDHNFQVTIHWSDQNLIHQLKTRFNIDLHLAKLELNPFRTISSGTYDYCFWVSDGSIPLLFSKINVLHFQVPFQHVHGKSWKNILKLKNIHRVICNSQFTKHIIDQEYGVNSQVIYPPATMMLETEKQPMILSVGRFDNLLHAKRHDVLIKAFESLNLPDWQLIIAGGYVGGGHEITQLQQIINHPNIKLIINPAYTELASLYGQAIFYWHAAGYGSDLFTHPEKAEHFGITTVEAMSAGAIPLVYNGGGQPEIVSSNVNGFLWNTPDELIKQTQLIIHDPSLLNRLKKQALHTASSFSVDRFVEIYDQTIS